MNVVFVNGDDWTGMYIDGVLVEEGHSISPYRAIEAVICKEVTSLYRVEANNEWLQEVGNLPKYLKDVKTDEE